VKSVGGNFGMLSWLSKPPKWLTEWQVDIPTSGFCGEKHQLMEDFLNAIREMTALQSQQMHAVLDGDPDFSRFDLLLHFAQEKKETAKYAWIAHVESHGCGEG
jgi:hypothetical protein